MFSHDAEVVAPQASTPVPAFPISTSCGATVLLPVKIMETDVLYTPSFGRPRMAYWTDCAGRWVGSVCDGNGVGMSMLAYGDTKLEICNGLRQRASFKSGRLSARGCHSCFPSTTGGRPAQPHTNS